MKILRSLRAVETNGRRFQILFAAVVLAVVTVWGLKGIVIRPGAGSVVLAAGDPVVQFSPAAYTVSQNGGTVEVSVSVATA